MVLQGPVGRHPPKDGYCGLGADPRGPQPTITETVVGMPPDQTSREQPFSVHASLGRRQASLDATIQGVVTARVIRRDSLMSQEDVAVVQSAYEAYWREDVQAI